jgi:hypothetical protein
MNEVIANVNPVLANRPLALIATVFRHGVDEGIYRRTSRRDGTVRGPSVRGNRDCPIENFGSRGTRASNRRSVGAGDWHRRYLAGAMLKLSKVFDLKGRGRCAWVMGADDLRTNAPASNGTPLLNESQVHGQSRLRHGGYHECSM